MIILAGDIGGTKTNLGLFEQSGPGGDLRKLEERTVPTNSAGSPEEIMLTYLKDRPSPVAAPRASAG